MITYTGDREAVIRLLLDFEYQKTEEDGLLLPSAGRELNHEYQEQLVGKVLGHYAVRLLVPAPVRTVLTVFRSIRYIVQGLKSLWHRRLEVSVLDAAAKGFFDSEFDHVSSGHRGAVGGVDT